MDGHRVAILEVGPAGRVNDVAGREITTGCRTLFDRFSSDRGIHANTELHHRVEVPEKAGVNYARMQ